MDYLEYCRALVTAIHAEPREIMDTTSAYFGRRYCTSCLREWGDMDVYLDAIATGNDRVTKYKNSPMYRHYRACCMRALFPPQHNIRDEPAFAVATVSSNLHGNVPSALAITAARQLPSRTNTDSVPEVINHRISLEILETLL